MRELVCTYLEHAYLFNDLVPNYLPSYLENVEIDTIKTKGLHAKKLVI